MTAKPLTGRKVFLITASAFGVIIAVNVTMAVLAVGTFPGLETKNSYVASQQFDRDREAQLALGWTIDAAVADDTLRLAITDRAGAPVMPASITATLGRATHVADDTTPVFTYDGTALTAPVDLAPGNWNLRFVATAEDGTKFRQRVQLRVR